MESQELREKGLKVTAPRLKILEIFETAKGQHLSAESIYQRLRDAGEDIGLATVYRVLGQFEAANMIIRHNFEGDHAVYELDAGDHHDHLVCVKCRKIVEFVDEVIEARQLEVAQGAGFVLTDHHLNIFGLCEACQ